MKVLVTGGAGFIGSHLTDRLLEIGHEVTLLDNLSVTDGKTPEYLNTRARLIIGDIMDTGILKRIIPEFDTIFHFAASVGIAQSNYEIPRFVGNNCLGTASLLQAIVDAKTQPRVIVAASNTTYGEGMYSCSCGTFHPSTRTQEQVEKYGFQPFCPQCKTPATPIPTPETTELNCNSVYAQTKKFQEETAIFLGKLYNFPVVALKYFNVFGTRQSLSNPYTGVSAIFMNRVKNGNIPVIYEDGMQTRDFISVHDVVDANILAMSNPRADYHIFNIGSGKPVTIKSLAEKVCILYGKMPKIEVNNQFRKGDIRHCIADTSKAKSCLGWKPRVSFDEGLKEIYAWAKTQESQDNFERADRELRDKGLI